MAKKAPIPIYSASSMAAGKPLAFTVFYLGGDNYSVTCSSRPKHSFARKTSIDAAVIRREIQNAYALEEVTVKSVYPTSRRFSPPESCDAAYKDGWEVAAEVCEGAIKDHVMRHIEEDLK